MPGFTGHAIVNSAALVGTTAFMVYDGWSLGDIAAVDAGIALATVALSPDMDLFTSRSMQEWGLMRFLWWPYARLVKHRDGLHTPLVGTSVRWLYMSVILGLLIGLVVWIIRRIGFQVDFSLDNETKEILFNLGYLLDIYIGANIADAMHFLTDTLTHGMKHGEGRFRPVPGHGLRWRLRRLRQRRDQQMPRDEWDEP